MVVFLPVLFDLKSQFPNSNSQRNQKINLRTVVFNTMM